MRNDSRIQSCEECYLCSNDKLVAYSALLSPLAYELLGALLLTDKRC